MIILSFSLRGRRLEVVGERENRRARGRRVSSPPAFCCAHYFQAPAMQAIYLLDRINCFSVGRGILTCTFIIVEAQGSET